MIIIITYNNNNNKIIIMINTHKYTVHELDIHILFTIGEIK